MNHIINAQQGGNFDSRQDVIKITSLSWSYIEQLFNSGNGTTTGAVKCYIYRAKYNSKLGSWGNDNEYHNKWHQTKSVGSYLPDGYYIDAGMWQVSMTEAREVDETGYTNSVKDVYKVTNGTAVVYETITVAVSDGSIKDINFTPLR